MVALNSDFAVGKPETDTKNRVGRFFSLAAESVGEDRRSSRGDTRKKRDYCYDIASVDTAFEYGPFGELIRATGAKKDVFNFRFSTKYEDAETGLLYYGYRYYNAETGRWLNRDPIEEDGGLNLYAFVGNDSVSFTDYLGQIKIEIRFNPVREGQEFLGKVRYHAYVIITKCEADATNPSGRKTYFIRGGPSAGGKGGIGALASPGGSFGPIITTYGDYKPGTIDWAENALSVTVFEDWELSPLDESIIVVNAFTVANKIERESINYSPLGPNSNSVAYQIIDELGYERQKPPVSAPGWQKELFRNPRKFRDYRPSTPTRR